MGENLAESAASQVAAAMDREGVSLTDPEQVVAEVGESAEAVVTTHVLTSDHAVLSEATSVMVSGGENGADGEVFQIVLESGDASGQSVSGVDGLQFIPVSGDNGATLQTITTDEDGQVTYVQVETVDGSEVSEGLLQAMEAASVAPDEASGEAPESPQPVVGPDQLADVVDGVDIMEVSADGVQQYLLQTPPNYKMDLLLAISQGVSEKLYDFPIFCQDGVIWSNKLLLTAVSVFIRDILAELGDTLETCLILPELTKIEFMAFHKALFARENDTTLDFVTLIKVAEVLGAELSLTTHFPPNEDMFPEVNYKSVMDSYHDRKRVFQSLGYDTDAGVSPLAKSTDGDTVLASLSRVLSSEHPCELCDRSFVDDTSLRQHQSMLHSGKTVGGFVRDVCAFECEMCRKTFAFAINVKKHKWLCHVKPKKEIQARASRKFLTEDLQAKRTIRAREKHEDMICKICGQEFNTWKQLQVHTMDHTNERPYKCETCGRGFKEPQKLRRHAVCHTGEKNFSCRFCGKTFGLRHNMKAHERIHEGKGNICKFCGKNYTQSSNLRDHERVHMTKKHVPTQDVQLRERQQLVKSRGRPSIMERHQKMMLNRSQLKAAPDPLNVSEEPANPMDLTEDELCPEKDNLQSEVETWSEPINPRPEPRATRATRK